MENAILVQDFIEQVWNNQAFDRLDDFLHPDFRDNSLPPVLTPDGDGLQKWIMNTGLSFDHRTVIDEQVTEGDRTIIRIRMLLKHVGVWRDIEPTGVEISTNGYRYFRLKDGKIIEHAALIDGQIIENQLKEAAHGCKVSV